MRAGCALGWGCAWTLLAGCSPPDATPARAGRVGADTSAQASAPTPAPARFGFGAPADRPRIERWDIDVGPDGVGLPPGRGTVEDGERVYLAHCATCHGATGTEGPFDVLVGGDPWGPGDPPRVRTIGNYWPWASTLFDYVRRAMPQNAPGSLTPDQTYAVLAWLLWRNGVVDQGAVLDPRTLPAVLMPARDRFVPDDRRGGPEVR